MSASAPSTSYALPSNPHPTTHRLPSIAAMSDNRRSSELQIPPWKAPADGGPPRRLSTGGFPSVFALPGGPPVEGLGIRGAETEDAAGPAPPPTSRLSKKRKSDPKGSTKDEAASTDRSGSQSPTAVSPRDARDSPNTSKRPRTAGVSLDSLASAASNILSQSASSQSTSEALAPPPLPRAASYSHASSPIGLSFADPKQAETVQASMGVREQQMREIERRRAGQPASGGGVTGLNDALGKLRAGKEKDKAQEKEKEGEGLGARRGGDAREKTRNLTVVTGFGGEASQGALRSAPAKVASVPSGASSSSRSSQSAYPTYREQHQSPREIQPAAPAHRRTSASAASGPTWSPGYTPAPNGTHRSVHVPTPLHASHTQRYPSHQLPNPMQQQSQGPRDASPPSHSHQYAGPAQYYYPPPSGGGPLSPGTRYGDPRGPPPGSARLEAPPSARDGAFSPNTSTAPSSKSQFLSLFSNFYDSLSDSRVLTRTLESQLAKSSSLLATLQDSGRMFEELVETKVVRILRDQARDNEMVERRLVRLEEMIAGKPRRGSQESSGSDRPEARPNGDREQRQESLLERLERLEKALEARERPVVGEKEDQAVQTAGSGSTADGPSTEKDSQMKA